MNPTFTEMSYFRQPFEDFTEITQQLIHFFVHFCQFLSFHDICSQLSTDSLCIVFGISSSTNPKIWGL